MTDYTNEEILDRIDKALENKDNIPKAKLSVNQDADYVSEEDLLFIEENRSPDLNVQQFISHNIGLEEVQRRIESKERIDPLFMEYMINNDLPSNHFMLIYKVWKQNNHKEIE